MKQIPVRKFPSGQGWPVVMTAAGHSELGARAGIQFEGDVDDLGEFLCAAIWSDAVGQLYFESRPHPVYGGVTVYVDLSVSKTQAVWAIEDEIGLNAMDFSWINDLERSVTNHRVAMSTRNGMQPPSATSLSSREREVAAAVGRGGRVPQIAADLGLKPSSVSTYLQRVYLKLGVHSRAELQEMLRRYPQLARSA